MLKNNTINNRCEKVFNMPNDQQCSNIHHGGELYPLLLKLAYLYSTYSSSVEYTLQLVKVQQWIGTQFITYI